jgi:hypothetical protein
MPVVKPALFLLAILSLPMPAGAGIVANGDFAEGAAHWRGDGHDGNPGITIQLDPQKWTEISQTFNTRDSQLQFSVTYSLSDDCSLAARPTANSEKILDQDIFAQLTGVMCMAFHDTMPSNVWMAYIFDPASRHFESVEVYSNSRDNPKTFTGFLNHLVEHEEKMLYLIFPPGTGSVTLTGVSLTPFQANTP